MQQIVLRSKETFLGDIIRSLLINTDLSDLSSGSDIATLSESVASLCAKLNTEALKILESNDINSQKGVALHKTAESMKLPNGQGGFGPYPAISAVGPVNIGSAFTKISSKLYAGKPAPYSGSSLLYLEDASKFPSTGSLYIGAGTVNRFEGPIAYTSPTNNGSFWTITTSTPLTKNHLQSDLVVLSQGGNRFVPAGTTVQTKASSEQTSVQFTTISDLLIADGESTGTVNVVCTQAGEIGNVLPGSIVDFVGVPFSGATVINSNAFRSGQSSESDEDLRQRMKTYPNTLSRGTSVAIQAAILSATDPLSGRTIQSTKSFPPVEPGEPERIFIDDSTGLEPSFGGQAYELLLASASGVERKFRVANFPVTAAVVIGANTGPFVLKEGLTLTIQLDEIVETYSITTSNYQNLLSATGYEIARDMNSQSNTVGFRTIDNGTRLVITDLSGSGEIMRVFTGDWQEILGLPTSDIRPIFVYKNNEIQSFRGKTATLETRPRSLWSLSQSDLTDVRILVDKVTVTFSVANADFTQYGSTIASATISQFAEVLSTKIPGVKFNPSGQILVWSTYQTLSPDGKLTILETKADGTPAGWIGDSKMWTPTTSGGVLSDIGQSKNYQFNRFTGELNFLTKPAVGTKIEVGSRSTRAIIESSKTSSGLFNLTPSVTTVGDARLILGFDGSFDIHTEAVPAGAAFTPTEPDPSNATNVLRLMANNEDVFSGAEIGDYAYIVKDETTSSSWSDDISSFYRIKSKGKNLHSTSAVFSTLPITTSFDAGVTAQTSKYLPTVIVTKTNHGLQNGDLIKVTTATAIGGISGANLSVTNSPVIVLSVDKFSYVAAANATSTVTGVLDSIGYNVVEVTQSLHGFETGSIVNIVAPSTVGGISSGNLSVSGAILTVLDVNTYEYRAAAASTAAASGNLTSVTYLPDTWIEFEVSDVQKTAWTPLLTVPQSITSETFHIFFSSVLPQLVVFDSSIGLADVDTIVESISSQISSGLVEKVSAQQLQLLSAKYVDGSSAVLGVIGNATSLFAPNVASSIQSHVGFLESGYTQGVTPVFQSVSLPASPGYPTRTYLKLDKDLVNITDITSDPELPVVEADTTISNYPVGFQVTWISGRQAQLTSRVYNNQTTAPYFGVLRGSNMIYPMDTSDTTQTNPDTLNRYANYSIRMNDLSISSSDRLVVEMDLDPVDNTISIPMGKPAQIQDIDAITGSGKGQVISFRLLDPDDSNRPFFDNTSVYKAFDFSDFKLLTHSVGVYREDSSDNALVLRSVSFGSPSRLTLSMRYPAEPSLSDYVVTHTTSYVGEPCLNIIVTMPSGPIVAGSLVGAGVYSIKSNASGTLFNWRVSHPAINAGGEYSAGNVINISGTSNASGSYQITSSVYQTFSGSTAAVTNGSPTVTVTEPGHGLNSDDIVGITTTTPIGGISAANLSVSYAQITVLNANSFTYQANASASSTTSGFLDSITSGYVNLLSPFDPGFSSVALFDAAVNTITSYPILSKSYEDLADAINDYLPANPVATAEVLGANPFVYVIQQATYVTYPNGVAYSGEDPSGAYNWNSFKCKKSGSAGIWQYDSSVPTSNNIKATVQTDDSIFPTVAEVTGTTYSPIGESVVIVPTNSKTLSDWMKFKASSSLNILASTDRIESDGSIQISSRSDGAAGAVKVTGVSANSVLSSVIGNGSSDGDATKITILTPDARALMPSTLVKVQNAISSEILRTYRLLPTGSSITLANPITVNTYFRDTNSVKYIRLSPTTARILFLRNGMGVAQVEPLDAGNTITLANLGSGLVQVTSAIGSGGVGTGKLSARTGDMMYIQDSSPLASDAKCPVVPSAGFTPGALPEYIGYPVVNVIDDANIVIIAPKITTFSTIALTSATDLVFMPAVWNEKNIRTNHKESVKFSEVVNSNQMYYLVKTLGNGLVSLWVQNSTAESTDTALLDTMSVGTDDLAFLGDGFDPANKGTFKIVAHNGKNHILFHNPEGGRDEIIDPDGDRKWRVGPIADGITRQLRVIAAESVQLGDLLRISTPVTTTQWFNSVMIGSFEIIGIGLSAFNFTGSLPHSYSNGSYDTSKICPYVDISIPVGAPINVFDSSGAAVDSFLVAGNDTSLGFVESTSFSAFRSVAGHVVNPINPEYTDVYVLPKLSTSKMTSTFGTTVAAIGKINFSSLVGQGIDGYKYKTGLEREAHRIIDGLPKNPILYPGVKAAGAFIDVQTPLIKSVQIGLRLKPKDGVTINTISDLVKSAVAGYVNNLGVGSPAVLSEIIRVVQGLPGVFSVIITNTFPVADDDRITVAESEKAVILDQSSDITIG